MIDVINNLLDLQSSYDHYKADTFMFRVCVHVCIYVYVCVYMYMCMYICDGYPL